MNAAIGRLSLSINLNPPADHRTIAPETTESDTAVERAHQRQELRRQIEFDRMRWSDSAHRGLIR